MMCGTITGWVNVLIPSLWISRLCLLMKSAKIPPLMLCSHPECLALKLPNMIKGDSVWLSSSDETSCLSILLLLGWMCMFPIKVSLLFIVIRFQIAPSLLFNKTSLKIFLLSLFITVTTPYPSFFYPRLWCNFLFPNF